MRTIRVAAVVLAFFAAACSGSPTGPSAIVNVPPVVAPVAPVVPPVVGPTAAPTVQLVGQPEGAASQTIPFTTVVSIDGVTASSVRVAPLSAGDAHGFQANVSFDAQTDSKYISWDYGDGGHGEYGCDTDPGVKLCDNLERGLAPHHVYYHTGVFTATLTARSRNSKAEKAADKAEKVASSATVVLVGQRPPGPPVTAIYVNSPGPVALGQSVEFTVSVAGGDLPTLGLHWDFGDPGHSGGTYPVAPRRFTYPVCGTFTAVVTASDSYNAGSVSASTSVVVTCPVK